MNNRFRRGSGCYTCKLCGKRTRDVDGNADVEMCQLCELKSGLENSLADHGWGRHGDLEHCKTDAEVRAEFTRLKDLAESRK